MSRIFGYCRISTAKQNIDRQETNIRKAYPDVFKIYKEEFTGRKIARPEWNRLYKIVKEGDTIVFDEVSRMSRNAEEGFAVYKDLYGKGVNLVFLKESYVNTDSYKKALKGAVNIYVNSGDNAADGLINDIMKAVNRFMFIKLEQDIYAAFKDAQREVDYLSQRTKEGMREAKEKGHIAGRRKGDKIVTKKSIEAKKQILKYSRSFYGSNTDEECIKIIKIAKGSYYKYKKELKRNYFLSDGSLVELESPNTNNAILKYASLLRNQR
jgi:DNA invertase Pin-like site-specific DNA recombinase